MRPRNRERTMAAKTLTVARKDWVSTGGVSRAVKSKIGCFSVVVVAVECC